MTKLAAPHIPVERFELKCGATLLVSHRPGAPVAAVQAHLRGGHSLDAEGLDGVAYLAGRLVDQGTATRTEEEIAASLEAMGGSVSGGSTGVSGTVACEHWKAMLDHFTDSLLAPLYPRDKFERQRQRLLERLIVDADEPRHQAAWVFRRLVYGAHWLGRAEHGSIESIGRIERKHLRAFHRKNWVASRAVIAFCGDVDANDVRRYLDRRLRDWTTGKPLGPPDTAFPARASRVAVHPADRQQVHIYLGHLGVRRTDPDYSALVVMDHILGTGPGFANRISRRLRDELGLAYSVSAAISSSAGVLPGTFTAYIGTNPESVETSVQGFLAEMRRIRDEPVESDELELARNYLTGSLAIGFERSSRRVQSMVSAHRNGLPDDYIARMVDDFERVTIDDIQRVATTHLDPDRSCLVAAGPVKKRDLQRLVQPPTRRRSRAS